MDSTCFMSRSEIAAVLKDIKRRAKRRHNSRLNLVIFRLSCCCGLRCSEILGLDLKDIIAGGSRPVIRVRKAVAKLKKKGRIVPLWWDAGTRDDIAAWLTYRQQMGALPDDPFVCSLSKLSSGKRLERNCVAAKWKTAIKVLGPDRVSQLSIHKGRHTYCSHVTVMKGLAAARDAAGHSNVSTTNIYLHALEEENAPNLFG